MIQADEAIHRANGSMKKQPLSNFDCPPSPPERPPFLKKLLTELHRSNKQPSMNGYLKKCSGEQTKKDQLWQMKYVEVCKGEMTWYDSREDKKSRKPEQIVNLMDSSISMQDDCVLRLEEKDKNVRLFLASSEALAIEWVHVISKFCSIPLPTRQGYCKKLSGSSEKRFQERYMKLTGDGILSWYKEEGDNKRRGAIQVRGETVGLTQDETNIVVIHTKTRKYYLKYLDDVEAAHWLCGLQFHAQRPRLLYTKISIRNNYTK